MINWEKRGEKLLSIHWGNSKKYLQGGADNDNTVFSFPTLDQMFFHFDT
jgi:hypothetical protein